MIVKEDVTLGQTAIPYVAALDGALRAGRLWEAETWLLAGVTGLAFQLVVDPKTCPSSPTAYSWSEVHEDAANRLGLRTRWVECIGDKDDFPAKRRQAVELIKGSLDRGQPALARTVDWAEFAVVVGYDDGDGVLFLDDRHADPVLYANFGSPEGFPFLFAQTFEKGSGLDLAWAARSSLEYAVACWSGKGFQKHPWYDFPVGAEAYGALVDAVQSGSTDPLGLRYILKIHADARECAARYTRFLQEERAIPGVEPAADAYAKAAPLLARVSELLPCVPPFERPIDPAAGEEAARLLNQAADLEEAAVSSLETTLN